MENKITARVYKAGEEVIAIEYSDKPGEYAPLSSKWQDYPRFKTIVTINKDLYMFGDLATVLEEADVLALELVEEFELLEEIV